MKKSPRSTSRGVEKKGHWDGLSPLERLNVILDYRGLFLALGLVSPREIKKVLSTSEGGREYIIDREGDEMFDKIDLSSPIPTQIYRDKLDTALSAVFFDLNF